MSIYVWGTGCGAGELFSRGLRTEAVSAFVDSSGAKTEFMGKKVLSPDAPELKQAELIIVSCRQTEAVRQSCMENGIPEDCLLFTKNNFEVRDLNRSCTQAEKLLGRELLSALVPRCRLIREPEDPGTETEREEADYVRIKTLSLICERLADVPGAAAELGVYRGDFARRINALLPDRTLYLFDSFQGFEPEEAKRELEQGRCSEAFLRAHADTDAGRILKAMPHRDRVRIYPGFFPQSLNGLEEHFCLVSLDADFEESTYEGLRYFWPRLNSGGFILLHDYNSPRLSGVKAALKRYEKEQGTKLPAVPLCDVNGSLVICR